MRYRVTLTLEVEIDPLTDDALIAEEGSVETAAIQMAYAQIADDEYADRVTATEQRAQRIA